MKARKDDFDDIRNVYKEKSKSKEKEDDDKVSQIIQNKYINTYAINKNKSVEIKVNMKTEKINLSQL